MSRLEAGGLRPARTLPLPKWNGRDRTWARLACDPLEGWFFLSAALLLVSGGAKLADPGPTSGALRVAGLVSSAGVVYGLAVAEIATGAAALIFGGRWTGWATAILYGAFGGFVILALRRGSPIASCGCFGKADTPPTVIHVFVNAAGVAGGIWAGLSNSPSLVSVLGGQPMAGVPYLFFLAAGTYAAYLLLTALPTVLRPTLAGTELPGHRLPGQR